MKNSHNLLGIFVLLLLSACMDSKVYTSTTTPPAFSTQEMVSGTQSFTVEAKFDWCTDLRKIGKFPTDDKFKGSHIIYLGSAFETGSSRDQIWGISMRNGLEKLLLDNLPSPFLGLGLLSDNYHFILVGSQVMKSDIGGSALKEVENIDELVADFRPYSPMWNLLADSPEATDARFGILHSPNNMYSSIWKSGDSALVIQNKETGKNTEIIQISSPDSVVGANWSPDGDFLTFTLYKNKNPYYTQVYIVNSDGSELRPLSQPFELELLGRPRWSPDGQKISIPLRGKDGWYYFVIISHLTGEIMRFRVSPIIRMDSILDQGEMVWSPDSKWLAYISQYEHFGIEILNVDNGEIFCGRNNENLAINMIDWR